MANAISYSWWKCKAHEIIAELCTASYRQANFLPNGNKRKKHVPYSVPALAQELVKCLNENDEVSAKSWFHYYYCGNVDEFLANA